MGVGLTVVVLRTSRLGNSTDTLSASPLCVRPGHIGNRTYLRNG